MYGYSYKGLSNTEIESMSIHWCYGTSSCDQTYFLVDSDESSIYCNAPNSCGEYQQYTTQITLS